MRTTGTGMLPAQKLLFTENPYLMYTKTQAKATGSKCVPF